ncbi:acyltransferase [Rhizobium sp. AQ_MP]|uniref:acyltransferase family protein n=1 Tax=Rhizobium sp. AQ_MP TaxID=2761536 RepID=UPI00163A9B67|nr:acyltransferase [Rhizobium sp. AQ_MP]MBC2773153.1 acyltransferase [Rhizobium sp. AQ_MP]
MRVLLIAGIVFVHIPYDPATSPYLGTHGIGDWIRIYLGDSLFRIGVPCLSAISGYLLFRRGLSDFDYQKVMRTKARTVLLPFLLWNLSFLLLVLVAQSLGIGHGYLPNVADATPREVTSHALALEAWPVNLPLYFLRDLLLCLALSPVIGHLVARYPRTTLLLFLAYAVLPVPSGIFLKKSILFGFSLGAFAALHQVDVQRLDAHARPVITVVGLASVMLAAGLYATGPQYPQWLDVSRDLVSMSGIFGAWALSGLLIQTRLGSRLGTGSGLSFWIFCAHYPLLVALWMIWNRTEGVPYLAFYILAPIVTIAVLLASHALLNHLAPGILAILTGNRVRSPVTCPSVRAQAQGRPANLPLSKGDRL